MKTNYNAFYEKINTKLGLVRDRLNRPLTLTEKIIYTHAHDDHIKEVDRGHSYILLQPDRVAITDIAAQTPILLFMNAGVKSVQTPTNLHLDHLVVAKEGADKDIDFANSDNSEVYEFLTKASHKYGIDVWKPGSGIVHQVILEQYAVPGGLLIGSDSHTPNAGGLTMLSIGIGGSDALDGMLGLPWELLYPKLVGVRLTGELNAWVSGKDVILKMLSILGVRGGTNKVIEYFGPGVKSLSCTAQATIANMGAELGATTSIFPFDQASVDYLKATDRQGLAALAQKNIHLLEADPEVYDNPGDYYDEIIEIDLSELEPFISGPDSPDASRSLSQFVKDVADSDIPEKISVGLIGSCTNSSYQDIGRAASVARQAIEKGVSFPSEFVISPGSAQVYATVERDGLLQPFEELGAVVMASACGPCIGQWKRKEEITEPNSILSSFNRNFKGRQDGTLLTKSFLASPEIVTAMSLSGRLSFNPLTDTLEDSQGNEFKLEPPKGQALPESGLAKLDDGLDLPDGNPEDIEIVIPEDSSRLQAITPFKAWQGGDLENMLVFTRVKGKCTTDHISPSGPWLRFRGHLAQLSRNMLLRAENSYTGEIGMGTNQLTGEKGVGFFDLGSDYKSKGQEWVIFAEHNYGEGSSREHAAMTPRFMGCRAVVAKSFARIAESNLKKHGVLPLYFVDEGDWEKVREDDRVAVVGLDEIQPDGELIVRLSHVDGGSDDLRVTHTLSNDQIRWFKAGSAINHFREENGGGDNKTAVNSLKRYGVE